MKDIYEPESKTLKEKLKAKAKKILLGVGLTAVAAGGIAVHKQNQENKENAKNEAINKEWFDSHEGVDSISADAKTTHFYAKQNTDTVAVDSLYKELKETETLLNKYTQEQKKSQDKCDKKLLVAAQKADAKGIEEALRNGANPSIKDKDGRTLPMITIENPSTSKAYAATRILIKNGRFDHGIKINNLLFEDMLQAKANGSDARWVSLKREYDEAKQTKGKQQNPVETHYIDNYTKGDAYNRISGENINLEKELETKPQTLLEINHYISLLTDKKNFLRSQISDALGYEVEVMPNEVIQRVPNLENGKITKPQEYKDSTLIEVEVGPSFGFRTDEYKTVEYKKEPITGQDVKEGLEYNSQRDPLFFSRTVDLYNKVKGKIKD